MSFPTRVRDMISHVIRVFDQDRGLARQMLVKMERDLTAEIAIGEEKTPVFPAGEIAKAAHESSSKFSAAEVRRLLAEGRDGGPIKHEP